MNRFLLVCNVFLLLFLAQGCTSNETGLQDYTVQYYLEGTTTQLADNKFVAGQTVGNEVTEKAILIDGYTADYATKSIRLLGDSGNNVITFYYKPDSNAELLDNITSEDVDRFFDMTKDEVIKLFGDNYEVVGAGAEGSYEGYYYKNYGLTFVFQYSDDVIGIDTDDKFDINGARTGMNFAQIQEHLGETEVIETWMEAPENIVYEVVYFIGKCKYIFYSVEFNGDNSWLFITTRAD